MSKIDADELQALSRMFSSEPLEAMIRRVDSAYDRLAAPYGRRVVLFGVGQLGKSLLQVLQQAGVEVVAFCDNNVRLWGTAAAGLTVLPPAEAVTRYNESAAFVVAVYNSSSPREQLRRLGCSRIIQYPVLFWKFWRHFPPDGPLELPYRLAARLNELVPAYRLLSDERSRREFLAQLQWRFLLDNECLPQPDPTQDMYFPQDLFSKRPDEVFVDCGAFTGDTVAVFLAACRGLFGRIYAWEADPGNVETLRRYCSGLGSGISDRITILPYALGAQDGVVSFRADSSVLSKIEESGAGRVPCRTMDTTLAGVHPTLIKMDIEGAEPEAIAGGRRILSEDRPVLAVCAYHQADHLWRIPQLLANANPDYRIFLRRYAEECWETVYYAVPPERLELR